jgi:hypothetical protein
LTARLEFAAGPAGDTRKTKEVQAARDFQRFRTASTRTDPTPGLLASQQAYRTVCGNAQHVGLRHRCPPGLPQLRGKRRVELALKAPHQRLAHCDIVRWLNPKSVCLRPEFVTSDWNSGRPSSEPTSVAIMSISFIRCRSTSSGNRSLASGLIRRADRTSSAIFARHRSHRIEDFLIRSNLLGCHQSD